MLESMQRVMWYVQTYEKLFAQRQMEDFGEKKKKELAEKRRELDRAKRRVTEIDGIIQKLYEDNAMDRISDERFATMSMSLENEQSWLKDSIPEMESYLENAKIQTEGLQRFIDRAKRITQLTKLTPELVHEFIQKIVVSKPEYRDGKRYQGVEILQRRWNYPRALARRNGRTVPRAYAEQEIQPEQQNSVATGLHCLHKNISIISVLATSLRNAIQESVFIVNILPLHQG